MKLFALIQLVVFSLCMAGAQVGFAQGEREGRRLLYEGNEAFKKGNYQIADSLYKAGLDEGGPESSGNFNLGNVQFRQEDLEGALSHYRNAERAALDDVTRADALYNAGNVLLAQQKPAEAVEAYKEALKLNPADDDARHNLMLAKQMLQQSEENQDDQEGDGDSDDGEDQEENDQSEQNKDDGENDGQNNPEDEGDNEQENQQDQQGKDPGDNEEKKNEEAVQPGQISKEDAERILEALNQREKELQQQLLKKKNDGKSRNIEKDW